MKCDCSLEDLQGMSARFAPVDLPVETNHLSAGDLAALAKLIEAARVIDRIFFEQLWSGNASLEAKLVEDRSRSAAPAWITSGSIKVPGPISTTTRLFSSRSRRASPKARTSIPKS